MSHNPRVRATVLVAGLFASGLMAGAFTGAAAAARARDPYAGLELFARVYTLVSDNYVDELDPDTLVTAAVRGMVDSLDPHSDWLTPEEYDRFRDDSRGSYEGIGVEVRRVPDGVVVARVLPGGPAERDGLLAGDTLVAVDGASIAGFTLPQVADLLKGRRGTEVVVTVVREGWSGPRDVTTVRDRVHTPAVLSERLPEGIGYARIVQFQDGTGRDLGQALDAMSESGPLQGLVLDLRDNPGGLLEEAVAVSDLFLDEGVIVSTRSRVEGHVEHVATPGGVDPALPIAVLVNGMSASASEIVAGALQDTGRAVVVGERTYGKGTVQTLYRNPDDSALKLTIGRYYTPSGEPVADRDGREPDLLVAPGDVLVAPGDVSVAPGDERSGSPAGTTTRRALEARITALPIDDAEREELLSLVAELPEPSPAAPSVPWDLPASERIDRDPALSAALDWLSRAR